MIVGRNTLVDASVKSDTRTKVHKGRSNESIWGKSRPDSQRLMIVYCGFGDTTYWTETRQARYPVVCCECERSDNRNHLRLWGIAAKCTDFTVSNLMYHRWSSAASTDTTSTALAYAGYFLLKFPHTWSALCEEIRREFRSVDEITQQRLVALPYLNAAIKEGEPTFPVSR